MRMIYRIPILFLLIVCAFIFASIGSMNGMGAFLLFALLFEGAFWFGLFKSMQRPRESRHS